MEINGSLEGKFWFGLSCEQSKASSSTLVNSRRCIAGTPMQLHQRQTKTGDFTSHADAKKDSVMNLCNPFVLLTHTPHMKRERLFRGCSVRSQLSLRLFGVISWRLSEMWERLSNSEFQISTLGGRGGGGSGQVRILEKESRWMLTRLYGSCFATRRLQESNSNHVHKRSPLSSLKPHSKQAFVVLTWEMSGSLFVF